jgi:hypothetical protein
MSTQEQRIAKLEQNSLGREARIDDVIIRFDCKDRGIEEPAYLKSLRWESISEYIVNLVNKGRSNVPDQSTPSDE